MVEIKQLSRLELRSVNKFLIVVKSKPCELCRRMCDMYRQVYFSQKMVTNWLNTGLLLRA